MHKVRVLIAGSLAVLAAACGSAAPPANGGRGSNGPAAAAYRYADCMRSHGVAGFPDPKVSVSPGHVSVAVMAPQSAVAMPGFKSAERACSGILPGPGTQSEQSGHRQAFLAFARCMRARGLSGFPDPNSQGRITGAMLSAAGLDLRSHAFYRAAIACAPVTHGVITRAQIAQAATGSH